MTWLYRSLTALALVGLVALSSRAQACSLDGKPTMSVNGYSVVINAAEPKVEPAIRSPTRNNCEGIVILL